MGDDEDIPTKEHDSVAKQTEPLNKEGQPKMGSQFKDWDTSGYIPNEATQVLLGSVSP